MIARPWHGGERALQLRAGSAARLAEIGPQVVRDLMPLQHRDFFESLPFVLAGTVDRRGRPWASMLVGDPGFVRSPDARTLVVGALPIADDPAGEGLRPGAPIGLLGIEAPTRRRNRANGHIVSVDGRGIRIEVAQSFGNCPKYIRSRAPYFVRDARAATPAAEAFTRLDSEARALVGGADTLYVASHAPGPAGDPSHGADVSHRGGRPGFVKVEDERTLLVPDFAGNRFFMTLGNLHADARAGVLFVDHERGDLLSLTGRAEIVESGLEGFAGAERGWRLHVDEGRRWRDALPLRWHDGEASPSALATGSWDAAQVAAS